MLVESNPSIRPTFSVFCFTEKNEKTADSCEVAGSFGGTCRETLIEPSSCQTASSDQFGMGFFEFRRSHTFFIRSCWIIVIWNSIDECAFTSSPTFALNRKWFIGFRLWNDCSGFDLIQDAIEDH